MVGQRLHAAAEQAHDPDFEQELGREREQRLRPLLVGAPIHEQHLGVRADVVDREEQLFDPIEGQCVHPAPRERSRQVLRRSASQDLLVLILNVIDAAGDGQLAPRPAISAQPELVGQPGPDVKAELLAVVGVVQAHLVQAPRHRPRPGLRKAGHEHFDAGLVAAERRVLALPIDLDESAPECGVLAEHHPVDVQQQLATHRASASIPATPHGARGLGSYRGGRIH
mmetsp:Transcript_109194/g.315504  ORF Transcript_109194/g.315504 Transcript_109194/m.315504 type:complete len:226 (+) Transcript_109194:493-1170(+)